MWAVNVVRKYGILIILLCIAAVFAVLNERFLTVSNLMTITRQITINGTVAVGMTLVILSAGVDLSVGGVIALAGAISAGVLASTGSTLLGVAVALLVGAAVGLVNGVFVSYAKLPPFIVTLATMAVTRGLTLIYTQGRPILVDVASYNFIGDGYLLGIPVPIIIMAATYLVAFVVLRWTKFGRYVYAIGGNENACRLSGLNVERIKTAVYVISGALAGLTAVILTARLYSAQPTAGAGYELDAIAAVILGGTSFSGGEGGVGGTIIGAFIIGILANGLNLQNVSPFYQDVAKGVVILVAVLLDRFLHTVGRSRA